MRLNQLQSMDPIAFEKYVGTLFARRGYRVEDTQASADEGIDLIVRQGRRMAVVQCKRYQGSVGQPVVRDLYGVMLHTGAVEAYLVTTGTVTAAARRWAEGKPIHLIDQHRLVEWVRTGHLNYEKPNVLKSNRPLRFVMGLLVVAVVVLVLVAPNQLRAAGDGVVNAVRPLLAQVESVFQPAGSPTPMSSDSAPAATATPTVLPDQDSTGSSSISTQTPIPSGVVTQPTTGAAAPVSAPSDDSSLPDSIATSPADGRIRAPTPAAPTE